jgi:predicted NUDIX family NTP pyrophosphohydrolase
MIYSAGILLYKKDENDEIVLLLGNDNKYSKWSDFGGKCEPSDNNNAKITASRECFEETCGVVYDILEFSKLINDTLMVKCDSYSKHVYYMYFLDISKLSSNLCDDFEKHTRLMKQNKKHLAKFLEKKSLQWFPICDVQSKQPIFRSVFFKSIICNYDNITELIRNA